VGDAQGSLSSANGSKGAKLGARLARPLGFKQLAGAQLILRSLKLENVIQALEAWKPRPISRLMAISTQVNYGLLRPTRRASLHRDANNGCRR
jgi:hypothetical protein